jgi:hypothetical protein
MTTFENQVQRFEEKLAELLIKVQTKQRFESASIDELNAEMNDIAASAKAQQLLPRKLLWAFRTGTKVLDAEIPYIKTNANELTQLASRLEYIMDLILLGESPSDRISGVPRII